MNGHKIGWIRRMDLSPNSSKPESLKTRIGELELAIPQTRNGGFYPSAIQKGLRSERALLATIAEMYIQGVSNRKVTKILEDLCDCMASPTSYRMTTPA
ncbi:hypothetical protein EBR57_06385 [bacterium]|nr:hypothetical protein [bacterium]